MKFGNAHQILIRASVAKKHTPLANFKKNAKKSTREILRILFF